MISTSYLRYRWAALHSPVGDNLGVDLDEVDERLHHHFGKGLEHMFGNAATAIAPWPHAWGSKVRSPYDHSVVRSLLLDPKPHLREIDPRVLHKFQSEVTRPGVEYYLSNHFRSTGEPYADRANLGNKYPFVYSRTEDNGTVEHIILSGHHRAAAALVSGQPLLAIYGQGGYGEEYR